MFGQADHSLEFLLRIGPGVIFYIAHGIIL